MFMKGVAMNLLWIVAWAKELARECEWTSREFRQRACELAPTLCDIPELILTNFLKIFLCTINRAK